MKLYPLREQLKSGGLLGMWVALAAPPLVESLGGTGYDLLVVDAEHAAFDLRELDGVIRAADIANLPALVRIPEVGPDIGRILDLGAAGVIVPRIDTPAQAAEVVSRCRFPPEGSRGAGVGRSGDYGMSMGPYLAQANQHLLAIVQIETRAGLEAVEEIAATPGLDGLCIGPLDLSLAIGAPIGSEPHAAAVRRIIAAAEAAGIAAVNVVFDETHVVAAEQAGAKLVIFGMDRVFAVNGARAAVAAVKAARAQ